LITLTILVVATACLITQGGGWASGRLLLGAPGLFGFGQRW
jgi:hypothetical protein